VDTVPSLRFDQVNLVVRDMEASRGFYTRLGLDFGPPSGDDWGPHHAQAAHGDDALADVELDSTASAAIWNSGWPGGPGIVVGFRVDTRQAVDDLVAALAAGGADVQQEPYDAFWGARYAIVSDPDGNAVGIMSPSDAAYRSEPPSPPPP
jgi:predicted lactoylglutathione lyase